MVGLAFVLGGYLLDHSVKASEWPSVLLFGQRHEDGFDRGCECLLFLCNATISGACATLYLRRLRQLSLGSIAHCPELAVRRCNFRFDFIVCLGSALDCSRA